MSPNTHRPDPRSSGYGREQRQPTVNTAATEERYTIFVGALPKDCQDEELYDAFVNFDKNLTTEVKRNEDYISRGFGFVTFPNKIAKDTALSLLRSEVNSE